MFLGQEKISNNKNILETSITLIIIHKYLIIGKINLTTLQDFNSCIRFCFVLIEQSKAELECYSFSSGPHFLLHKAYD